MLTGQADARVPLRSSLSTVDLFIYCYAEGATISTWVDRSRYKGGSTDLGEPPKQVADIHRMNCYVCFLRPATSRCSQKLNPNIS